MTVQWLSVAPLDTVMVRDGRRFDAGVDARAVSTTPPPSTFGGALHTALDRRVGEILGVLTRSRHGLVFPPPADLVVDEGALRRLTVLPRDPDLVWDLDELHVLSHVLMGPGELVADRWITADGLTRWLAGAQPSGERFWLAPVPWTEEPRLGLARHWDGELAGTARPGLLYSLSHLRPEDGLEFLVPVEDPDQLDVVREVVPFGGRGRMAQVTPAAPVTLPPAPTTFPDGRVSVYLATPALLGGVTTTTDSARADVWWAPDGATLCALALAGPTAVATATNRGGADHGDTRCLNWALPAGTAFYLRFPTAERAAQWAGAHHGRLVPGLSNSPLRTAGFGLCLTGSW